jgi:AcrR family transcriptional regulator
MRAIAREAGYTTGVLSHYFRDKRELMEYGSALLVDHVIDRVATAARDDPAAAIAELLPLDDRRRNEAQLWLTMLGWSNSDPALAEELSRRHEQVRRQLRPVVSRLFPVIAADDDRVHDVTDHLLAVVDGLTVDAIANPDSYSPDRLRTLLHAALSTLSVAIT